MNDESLDFDKGDGLLTAVVQHADDGRVLMVGHMNREALALTRTRGRVVFFSRSRQKLWEKGETSGNTLDLVDIRADCDADALLVRARPRGPVCHTGAPTCFGEAAPALDSLAFLHELEAIVAAREHDGGEASYTATLLAGDIRRIAQKVGEEGVEVALAAVVQDDASLVGEAADLLFHLTVLLRKRTLSLGDVAAELQRRHRAR